jgi:C4-dicarboxylate-specific signal transduction histidine kinase
MLAEEKLQNSHDKLQLSVEERTANFVMTTEQMKREIRKQKK